MQQSLSEDTINTLARGIVRAAAEHTAATAEAQRLLGRAVVAAANEAAWRALYQQLAAPLAALMSGHSVEAATRGIVLRQALAKLRTK